MNESTETVARRRKPDIEKVLEDWAAVNAAGTFTGNDWVTNKLRRWVPALEPLREKAASILEIGSYEGRSAMFFLHHMPNATITCIDPFLSGREPTFDANLAQFAGRVTKLREYSLPALMKLRMEAKEFDVIYIDGSHEREAVMLDNALSWGALKKDGILIWDDYGTYKDGSDSWERPTDAIDGFLRAVQGEYEELSRTKQLIVKKTKAYQPFKIRMLGTLGKPPTRIVTSGRS
jgi:hypothetical protein